MRVQQCPWCGKRVEEANHLWDQVALTGACPFCHRFYDRAREAEIQHKVAVEARAPGFVRALWRERLRTIGEGLIILVLAALLVVGGTVTHLSLLEGAGIAALAAAVGRLAWALVVNPERHVRGTNVGEITSASPADRALLEAARSERPEDKP